MTLFKKIKRLEELELDCPYIKRCELEDSEILDSCRKGGYYCSIYLSNKKSEEEKSEEEK